MCYADFSPVCPSGRSVEAFFSRVQSGDVENVAGRSALSTMIGILGRTAVYSGQEVSWKGIYGVYG